MISISAFQALDKYDVFENGSANFPRAEATTGVAGMVHGGAWSGVRLGTVRHPRIAPRGLLIVSQLPGYVKQFVYIIHAKFPAVGAISEWPEAVRGGAPVGCGLGARGAPGVTLRGGCRALG